MNKKRLERLKRVCNVCRDCNGIDCTGSLPGMGGAGSGDSFRANCADLRRYSLLKPNGAYEQEISTSFDVLGVKVSMPIFNAPITGMKENLGGALSEWEYARYSASASKQLGTFFFSGDGAGDEKFFSGLWAARDIGAPFISIIKPRSQKRIMGQIDIAQSMGALAVGVDVDSFGLLNMAGKSVEKKSKAQLEELVKFSSVPFIVKGILDVKGALLARDAGALGIVVSNHGGRVAPQNPSAWNVMPLIREALKDDDFLILGDGGVRSGKDVFTALALGASAVLVGRPVLIGAVLGGESGVITVLKSINENFVSCMSKTGCKNIKDITSEKVFVKNYSSY